MKKPSYTPEEMKGKFVTVSSVLSSSCPALSCVIHTRGEHTGMPVLYNSRQDAESDQYFDKDWDIVMSAPDYFEQVNSGKVIVINE